MQAKAAERMPVEHFGQWTVAERTVLWCHELMGQLDDYLRGQVTPQLMPGEQIMGMAALRRPLSFNLLQVPEKYQEWLATATNMRLILFRTEGSGLFNVLTVKLKPKCLEVHQWWYQELREVTLGTVNGMGAGVSLGLVPHEPLGPVKGESRRYDMFPQAEDLDGHAQFYAQFRQWLQQQVAAGAFPMDAQRQAVVAEHKEKIRLEEERKRKAAEERKRKASAAWTTIRPYVPGGIGLLFALALGGGGLTCALAVGSGIPDSMEELSLDEKLLAIEERNVKWRAAGQEPPPGCPEYEGELEKHLLRGREDTCKGTVCNGCCKYFSSDHYAGSVWMGVTRGDDLFQCPPVDVFKARVEARKETIERKKENRNEDFAYTAGGVLLFFLGLVLLLVSVVLLVKGRRKVKAAAAAG